MWMISSLLTFIFPPTCISCGATDTSFCQRCITLARKSLNAPHSYIISIFDFKDPVIKRAIHALKYYHRKDLSIPLASALAKELRKLPNIETYSLVPIPMPWKRKLLRGYNQAECLAEKLSGELGIPLRTDILIRIKSPARQVTLRTREGRLKNQKGSFSIPTPITDMNLLLVDDVSTTGATIEAARAVLLSHGAASVHGATVAH
jgi:ComF family protein